MSPARIPLALEDDPYERAARQRAAQRAVRRQRVEREGLDPCPTCGGAVVDVADESLGCVCDAERAALESRAARLAHEHRDDLAADRSDQIAP